MYGIFAYINLPNVGKYSIHGASGNNNDNKIVIMVIVTYKQTVYREPPSTNQ